MNILKVVIAAGFLLFAGIVGIQIQMDRDKASSGLAPTQNATVLYLQAEQVRTELLEEDKTRPVTAEDPRLYRLHGLLAKAQMAAFHQNDLETFERSQAGLIGMHRKLHRLKPRLNELSEYTH